MSDGEPSPIRLVFFGTADFAVPSLTALAADSRFGVVHVITQPDRPRGRGRSFAPPPVKVAAAQLGLPVVQPTRLRSRSLVETLRALSPDFFVVAAYGRILPPDLLAVPYIAPVNIHGSLLPAYRGAAPIQRALLDGCETTGVTTMLMTDELDAGDILLTAAYTVQPEDNAGTVTAALARMGAELIVQTLVAMRAGTLRGTPQDHERATFAPPITPEDTVIRWEEPARRVVNRIRAMAPRPGAVTAFGERRIKVLRAKIGRPSRETDPGTVVEIARDGVTVMAGDGAVVIAEVHPEGKRPMPASDWARGARISIGDRFALTLEL